MQKKGIVHGALILTVANILTRILGFFYRIYMSKAIGAEGMGLYQLIMPIYLLVWSISSSGFSTTISKLTAQENARKNYGNMNRILKQSVGMSIGIALFLSFLMFFFSKFIAIEFLKDERCAFSLQIISFCFPFMACGSCIRGYFFGLQETTVPAVSQVIEQIARMVVIYFFAGFFIPMGIKYACAVAVFGMCIGEIISFIYVFFSYKNFKEKNLLNKKPSLNIISTYTMILAMAIPLTLNRVTGSFLSTIENILIPQKLSAFGMSSKEAMSLYGELSGMAMPLIMFPSSLLTAISTALIPAVSEAQAVKNSIRIKKTIAKSMLLTSIIAFGSCGIFLTFPKELGVIIYSRAELKTILIYLSYICPFLYLQVTLSGILNGLGDQLFIFRMSLLSSFINIAVIYFLIPVYGIKIFFGGWLISSAVISIISLRKIKKETNLKFDFITWFLKPILSITASCLIGKIIYTKLFSGNIGFLSIISVMGVVSGIYISLLFIVDCVKKENFLDLIKSL